MENAVSAVKNQREVIKRETKGNGGGVRGCPLKDKRGGGGHLSPGMVDRGQILVVVHKHMRGATPFLSFFPARCCSAELTLRQLFMRPVKLRRPEPPVYSLASLFSFCMSTAMRAFAKYVS